MRTNFRDVEPGNPIEPEPRKLDGEIAGPGNYFQRAAVGPPAMRLAKSRNSAMLLNSLRTRSRSCLPCRMPLYGSGFVLHQDVHSTPIILLDKITIRRKT